MGSKLKIREEAKKLNPIDAIHNLTHRLQTSFCFLVLTLNSGSYWKFYGT